MSPYKIIRGGAYVRWKDGDEETIGLDILESAPGVNGIASGAVGVRLLDGPLAGAVILVPRAWLEKLKREGEPADHLEL